MFFFVFNLLNHDKTFATATTQRALLKHIKWSLLVLIITCHVGPLSYGHSPCWDLVKKMLTWDGLELPINISSRFTVSDTLLTFTLDSRSIPRKIYWQTPSEWYLEFQSSLQSGCYLQLKGTYRDHGVTGALNFHKILDFCILVMVLDVLT